MAKKILFLFLALISSNIIYSQGIITDRPDKTESVETVGKNKFQIETGVEYSLLKFNGYDGSPFFDLVEFKIKTLTIPTTLLRFGITKNVELRLGFDFDRSELITGDTTVIASTGKLSLNPPTIGAKIFLAKGKGYIPDFSIIGAVKIPDIGDELKQVKHFIPELAFSFSNELNDKLGLGYNLGAEWSDDLKNANFFYSASLGIELTPRLGSFIELYGNFPTDYYSSDQNIDGGFTYVIKNNIQVDVYGGLGLSEISNDFMLGTGVALKF